MLKKNPKKTPQIFFINPYSISKNENNTFPESKGRGGNHEDSSLLHSLIDLKVCI